MPPAGPPRASCPGLFGDGLVEGFLFVFCLFVLDLEFLFDCVEYYLLVFLLKSNTGGASTMSSLHFHLFLFASLRIVKEAFLLGPSCVQVNFSPFI